MAQKYYFSTRDLLTIALLSLLGAILSTYVGYVGSTFASLTGIPFGGQLLSGLHIFWIVLVLVVVNKKGAGLLAGALDNIVQFLLGSHMGIYVLLVGVVEGIFAEIGFWPLKKYRTLAIVIAGGLSSWSNLLVTQFLFNKFGGLYLFGTVSVFAFLSGMVFGGLMVIGILRLLQDAGVISRPEESKKPAVYTLYKAVAVVLVCAVVVLLAAHYVLPASSKTTAGPGASYQINVTDSGGHVKAYDLASLKSSYVTVNATLKGTQSAYTGVPVSYLLKDSGADQSGSTVTIAATDGYVQTFPLAEVTGNNNLVLYPSNKTYSLAANGYSSQQWVRDVAGITVS